MKEKYNFIPLTKKKQYHRGNICVSLSKLGILRFSKEFQRVYMPERMFCRILIDEEKRTVGIELKKEIDLNPAEKGEWRMITLNAKTGNASTSVRNLTSAFGIKESISGIPIEEHTERFYGQLLIFKIPL